MRHHPFLSHQWRDKNLVRQIAEGLVADGMDPILDVWKFVPGDSLTKSMESGVASATSLVLFWSKHAAGSQNVDYERELGLVALRKRPGFRVICVVLDDTPPPAEHSFRLHLNWRKGKRPGAAFDDNLKCLARAIRGMPLEDRPEKPFVTQNETTWDKKVQTLVREIGNGNNLLIAYKCPFKQNPISGRTIPTTTFFDELHSAAQTNGEIIVLDYDTNRMDGPYVYIPSYNLVKIAQDRGEFIRCKKQLKRALKAYDAPYGSPLGKKYDPWRDGSDGGGRFIGGIAGKLDRPVLAILRNIHWETQSQSEPSYVYADDIPALGLGMSVVFDLWHEHDWNVIRPLINYFVDDTGKTRKLVKA